MIRRVHPGEAEPRGFLPKASLAFKPPGRTFTLRNCHASAASKDTSIPSSSSKPKIYREFPKARDRWYPDYRKSDEKIRAQNVNKRPEPAA